jgi:Asp-tRNA(Asn)/Glu-tRNA(Gln) amidotransferase A subunit family amidase
VAGPVTFDDPVGVYTRIEGVDMFVGHDPVLWRERLDELDPLVAPGWRSAAGATLPKLAAVEEARQRIVARAAEVFADVDVVLTPMTAVPAFAAEGPMPTEVAGHRVHGGMSVVFGMFANLVNLPAVSVPAGVTSDGLPVGLQVIGRRFREDVCLRLARVLEQAAPWPRWAPGR